MSPKLYIKNGIENFVIISKLAMFHLATNVERIRDTLCGINDKNVLLLVKHCGNFCQTLFDVC